MKKLHERYKDSKKIAWDGINDLFMDIGHQYMKCEETLTLLLRGVKCDDLCCVVGASTIFLIKELMKRKTKLTIIDFSEKMCHALQKKIGLQNTEIIVDNYLYMDTKGSFKYIFADQLINCLDKQQIFDFFKTSSKSLQEGGELICIIKIGLYDFDKLLLAYARSINFPTSIYDHINNTIDYSLSRPFIHKVIHERIHHQKTLINWYLDRNREKRFTWSEIASIEKNYHLKQYGLRLLRRQNITHHDDLLMLRFLRVST